MGKIRVYGWALTSSSLSKNRCLGPGAIVYGYFTQKAVLAVILISTFFFSAFWRGADPTSAILRGHQCTTFKWLVTRSEVRIGLMWISTGLG
jgi:hypothetical protein